MRNSYPHSNNIDIAFWTVDIDEKGFPFLPGGEDGNSASRSKTGPNRTIDSSLKTNLGISEIERKKNYQKFLDEIGNVNGSVYPLFE
jgi:hypothetical protein